MEDNQPKSCSVLTVAHMLVSGVSPIVRRSWKLGIVVWDFWAGIIDDRLIFPQNVSLPVE